jgi:hypothetical protein
MPNKASTVHTITTISAVITKIRFEEGVVWEGEYPLLGQKVWGFQGYATQSKVSVING